jgi:hypothetical protein
MRYRKMRTGEIIQPDDEYISVNGKTYKKVDECSIGKELLECNIKYYRRPILSKKELNNEIQDN